MFSLSREGLFDVGERAVRTFVQTFLALYAPVILGADSLDGVLDLSTAEKALTAAVAATLAAVMGALGMQTGTSKDDGSIL